MSDVADILGFQNKGKDISQLQNKSLVDEASKILNGGTSLSKAKEKKPKGMNREVFDLLGSDAIIPSVQTNAPISSFKDKRRTALKGKWIFIPIVNSAREVAKKDFATITSNYIENNESDPLKEKSSRVEDKNIHNPPIFYHWIKADLQFSDYPYAKFNVQNEPIIYSDTEYESYLKDSDWLKSDTDELIQKCNEFDLRWPVIFDRLKLVKERPLEDIQKRYFDIATKIKAARVDENASFSKDPQLRKFNVENEKFRRKQQDLLFRKTKEDEKEELNLKEELKAIDNTLKKLKKMGKLNFLTKNKSEKSKEIGSNSLAPEGKIENPAASQVLSSANTKASSDTILVTNIDNRLQGPKKGIPCLQSSRLYLIDGDLNIPKKMLVGMNSYLRELKIPETPIPTKEVCDLVEGIRRDTVALLSMKNILNQKEKELQKLSTTGVKRKPRQSSTDKTQKSKKIKSENNSNKGQVESALGETTTKNEKKGASEIVFPGETYSSMSIDFDEKFPPIDFEFPI